MRLIDVDLLEIETQDLEDVGQGEMQFYSVEQIDNAPTVEAILRERINKAIAEIRQEHEKEWERENYDTSFGLATAIDIIHKYCDKEET